MAKGDQPSTPEKPANTPAALREALGDSLRFGIPKDTHEALSRIVGAYSPFEGSTIPTVLGSGLQPASQPEISAPEGALAGGADQAKPKRNRRDKHGKTLLQGGDRIVKYYKPTEAEIDRLGDLSKDESAAWSRMYFCLGVLANIVVGLLFATGLSTSAKAVGYAVGIGCLALALRFWRDAFVKSKAGASALQKIKADHDFGTI